MISENHPGISALCWIEHTDWCSWRDSRLFWGFRHRFLSIRDIYIYISWMEMCRVIYPRCMSLTHLWSADSSSVLLSARWQRNNIQHDMTFTEHFTTEKWNCYLDLVISLFVYLTCGLPAWSAWCSAGLTGHQVYSNLTGQMCPKPAIPATVTQE